MSVNLGAGAVADAARALERLLDGADQHTRMPDLLPLEQALVPVLAGLERYFSKAAAEAAPLARDHANEDPALREVTAHLSELLESFSGDSPDYFNAERAVLASALGSVQLDRLASLIESYQFAEAREALLAALG